MIKNIPIICFALLLLTWTACESNNEELVVHSIPDYLPLKVGNYWELTFPNGKSKLLELDKVVNLDGKDYFRIVSSGYLSFSDTSYYRKDPYWKVYKKQRGSNEVLLFDFGVPVSYKWVMQVVENNLKFWAIVVSKTDTVQSHQYTFENCYRYYYNVIESADEEFGWDLAPGVGFVKSSNAWLPDCRLTRAKIDGKEITTN